MADSVASYSADFSTLLALILDGLCDGDGGRIRIEFLSDLAPLWPVDLIPSAAEAVRDLGLPDRETAQTIEALVSYLDVLQADLFVEESRALRPSLAPHFGAADSASFLRQKTSVQTAVDAAQIRARRIVICRPIQQELARKQIALDSLPLLPPLPIRGLRFCIRQLALDEERRLLFELVTTLLVRTEALSKRARPGALGVSVPSARGSNAVNYSVPFPAQISFRDVAPPTSSNPFAGDEPDFSPSADDVMSLQTEDTSPPVISTGFSDADTPQTPIPPQRPLFPERGYYFWLQLGKRVSDSIELQHIGLPKELVHEGALLDVVLFSFSHELELTPSACIGTLRVESDGSARVVSQPGISTDGKTPFGTDGLQRLFFPLRTPPTVQAGTVLHLRCSIYCNQVLLQSRLISAELGNPQETSLPQSDAPRLRSLLDYSLIDTVASPDSLRRITPHKLSLFLNDNPDGTHSFRFFAKEGNRQLRHEVTLDRDRLSAQIQRARGELRRAAWGDTGPWKGPSGGQSYRYADQPRSVLREQLYSDLIRLAKSGATLYAEMARHLTSSVEESFELADLMRTPGFLQIASKVTATQTVPAALLYDQPLSVNPTEDKFTICDAFRSALESAQPLDQCPCFLGNCPSYDRDTVVCPSGFWGFRHFLGMPLTGPNRSEAQPQILYHDAPRLSVGVSLELHEFPVHEKALRNLRSDLQWQCESSAQKIFQMLKEGKSHLVYFYCHGGESPDLPFLEVGNDEYIVPRALMRYRIRWQDPRPIVFLNGCHTTAVDSEQVMDLVSEFVEIGQASGVIGTEITIFEPMARAFAEECLRRFFAGQPIGQSIRSARLSLLKQCNPLGLAYDPYVLATVCLAKQ
ncbi:MAG: hypothetical protein U0787_22240 [Polyangia bacterium]